MVTREPAATAAATKTPANNSWSSQGIQYVFGQILEVLIKKCPRLLARSEGYEAAVEDVDYRAARGLDRTLFQKLAEGAWIDAHENLILCGPTGVGKSWLASALGHKACRDNRSVLQLLTPRFVVLVFGAPLWSRRASSA
jgi:hypothetical protein